MYSTTGGGVSHSPHKWNSVYNGYLQRVGGVSLSPCKWNFVYSRYFFTHHKQLAMMLWLWSFEASLRAKAPSNSVEPRLIPHWPHPLLARVRVPETKQKSMWKPHLNEDFTDLLLKWKQCCSEVAASLPWEWRNLTTLSQKKYSKNCSKDTLCTCTLYLYPCKHINYISHWLYILYSQKYWRELTWRLGPKLQL